MAYLLSPQWFRCIWRRPATFWHAVCMPNQAVSCAVEKDLESGLPSGSCCGSVRPAVVPRPPTGRNARRRRGPESLRCPAGMGEAARGCVAGADIGQPQVFPSAQWSEAPRGSAGDIRPWKKREPALHLGEVPLDHVGGEERVALPPAISILAALPGAGQAENPPGPAPGAGPGPPRVCATPEPALFTGGGHRP